MISVSSCLNIGSDHVVTCQCLSILCKTVLINVSLNIECSKVSPGDISGWLHLAPSKTGTILDIIANSQVDPDSSLLAWGLTIKAKNLDRPVKVALVLADCDEVTTR